MLGRGGGGLNTRAEPVPLVLNERKHAVMQRPFNPLVPGINTEYL